jgi:hypothetical protein
MHYNILYPQNKHLISKKNFMNELSTSHLGLSFYIPTNIENNILCAQNITLIPNNNQRKMFRQSTKQNEVKCQMG